MAASTTSRGKWIRPFGVQRQPVVHESLAHLRAADLHPRLGQDAHRFVDDPADELGLQDVQAGSHGRSVAGPDRPA